MTISSTPVPGSIVRSLDVLFVVDASPTIAPHLARLRASLPAFLSKLALDAKPDRDSDAYRDLHIGVISSNLSDDDGVLRGGAACGNAGFVWYYDGYHDRAETLASIDCALAQVGESSRLGQPLEAALKALSPSDPGPGMLATEFAAGALGHGDRENTGFQRKDSAALLIIIVTDRDDCSSVEPATGDPIAACADHPELLAPLQRYVDGYSRLQPQARVTVVLLAGVPTDLANRDLPLDFDDEPMRRAYFEQLLADPRLQLRAAAPSAPGQPALAPSCTVSGAAAYPPRRLIEFIRANDRYGLHIASLCADDLASAMYEAWYADGADWVGPCVSQRPLAHDAQGFLPCRLTWQLPLTRDPARPLTPTSCEERPEFLSVPWDETQRHGPGGTTLCDVRQLPVLVGEAAPRPDAGQGFYIDYVSRKDCLIRSAVEIAHTPSAKPPAGVTLVLHCTDDTQHLPNRRGITGAQLGDLCEQSDQPSSDALCRATERGGQVLDRFCHPDKHVCVRGCQSDAECPTDWICDSGSTHFAATAGRPICVNPSCGGD